MRCASSSGGRPRRRQCSAWGHPFRGHASAADACGVISLREPPKDDPQPLIVCGAALSGGPATHEPAGPAQWPQGLKDIGRALARCVGARVARRTPRGLALREFCLDCDPRTFSDSAQSPRRHRQRPPVHRGITGIARNAVHSKVTARLHGALRPVARQPTPVARPHSTPSPLLTT